MHRIVKNGMRSMTGMAATVVVLSILACGGSSGTSETTAEGIGSVDRQLKAPGDQVTGLAWGGGSLWVLDDGTDTVYAMDTGSGEVVLSFPVDHDGSLDLTGLAYSHEHQMVLVGLWDGSTNGYIYRYSSQGEFRGSVTLCGG